MSDEIEDAMRVTTSRNVRRTDVPPGADERSVLQRHVRGSAAERDEWQMPPAVEVKDMELERAAHARLATKRVTSRAGGWTQLKSWTPREHSGIG